MSLAAGLHACTCWDGAVQRCPIHHNIYTGGPLPTTRDLLDAAAAYVADAETLGVRPAKARVHDMELTELVALPPVRRLLYEAATRQG